MSWSSQSDPGSTHRARQVTGLHTTMTNRQQLKFDGNTTAYDKAVYEAARNVASQLQARSNWGVMDAEFFACLERVETQLREDDMAKIKAEVGDLCLDCHEDPYICTCHMAVYE